jgi:hypothetical protein
MDLTGAWSLVSSINYRDGVGTPSYGIPPAGQLQYTADGRMSAFLMDPAWVARKGAGEIDSFTDFFSYAGRWRIEADQVIHDIELSSVATKVGTRFVRTVRQVDADTIELETAPEVSKSGATYITRLTWRRFAAD